jgi:5-(carboxyamino)imidazole ribonucleotide synthase
VRECGIPTAPFAPVRDARELDVARRTRLSGGAQDRDGRLRRQGPVGRARRAAAEAALRRSARRALIFERFVPFDRELSIICARDAPTATSSPFPSSENVHDHGVLAMTIVPGRASRRRSPRARTRLRETIGERLGIVGAFASSSFVAGDEVLVNEIAPRVHNSGHYSLDATQISQYEAHVRAICDLPLVEAVSLSRRP